MFPSFGVNLLPVYVQVVVLINHLKTIKYELYRRFTEGRSPGCVGTGMLYLRKSEQDQSGSGLQRQDDLHLQLSVNSDDTPIRDHILVFSRFNEAIC